MFKNTRLVFSILSGISLAIAVLFLAGTAPAAQSSNLQVVIQTTMGDITVELYKDKAPKSVENFLAYVKDGFYAGTIFHRVIPNFMIQGGGMSVSMARKPTKPPIPNEAGNGLKNNRGTIAMARTSDVDSATAQFFINVKDNASLNHTGASPEQFGYAVFGKVVSGMDVVDQIVSVPTETKGSYANAPVKPVVIKAVTLK